MRRHFRRLYVRTRDLWDRARRERSSPRQIGWSVAVGVFSGCTPFLGLHMWIALGLATALRLNRLWAFLGSRVSSNVLYVWLAFAEIQLAHRLRAGQWAPIAPAEVLAHGGELLLDWLLGAALIGAALAAVLGLLAYVLARRTTWLSPRSPDEPRPPTSESPPTAPPAPTS